MSDRLVDLGRGFWNVRSSFRIGGVLDVGNQCSLIRLADGRFVLLDACKLRGEVRKQVLAITAGGRSVDAILHLHPFHTTYVEEAANLFPNARLFGTERHKSQAPKLPWQVLTTDDPDLHEALGDELIFSVPRGVALIPQDEKVHFSSVLVAHAPSATLHVDDTLSYLALPLVGGVRFHPTLRLALEPRAGAADAFTAWARELIQLAGGVRHLCTAHGKSLPPVQPPGGVARWIEHALNAVKGTLERHRGRHG